MKIGYFLSCEEYPPRATHRAGQAGAGRRARPALDLRPLPPVDRRAGRERVRLVGDRRAVAGRARDARHDGRHLPDGAHPSRDHRPGGRDLDGAARGALLARRRIRRGAQRAHPGRPLARGRRAAGDARGGDRDHARDVGGRPVQPRRAPLPRRERAHLHAAGAAARHPRLRLRAEGRRSRRPGGRRLLRGDAREGLRRPLPRGRRREQARPGRHEGVLRPGRRRVRQDRAPAVAERGPAR